MINREKWQADLEAMSRALELAGEEMCETVRNRAKDFYQPRRSHEQQDYDREYRDGWAKPGSNRY